MGANTPGPRKLFYGVCVCVCVCGGGGGGGEKVPANMVGWRRKLKKKLAKTP